MPPHSIRAAAALPSASRVLTTKCASNAHALAVPAVAAAAVAEYAVVRSDELLRAVLSSPALHSSQFGRRQLPLYALTLTLTHSLTANRVTDAPARVVRPTIWYPTHTGYLVGAHPERSVWMSLPQMPQCVVRMSTSVPVKGLGGVGLPNHLAVCGGGVQAEPAVEGGGFGGHSGGLGGVTAFSAWWDCEVVGGRCRR